MSEEIKNDDDVKVSCDVCQKSIIIGGVVAIPNFTISAKSDKSLFFCSSNCKKIHDKEDKHE